MEKFQAVQVRISKVLSYEIVPWVKKFQPISWLRKRSPCTTVTFQFLNLLKNNDVNYGFFKFRVLIPISYWVVFRPTIDKLLDSDSVYSHTDKQ